MTHSTFRSPDPSDKIGLVQPGLVYVDDSLALLQEPEQLQCKLLSLDKDPLRIGFRMSFFAFDEVQTKARPHYLPCVLLAAFIARMLFHGFADLLRVDNVLILLHQRQCDLNYHIISLLKHFSLFFSFTKLLRLVPSFAY